MTASKRVVNAKTAAYAQRVVKRIPADADKKSKSKLPVGPVMLGFFLFLVVGSAVLQIIRAATTGRIEG